MVSFTDGSEDYIDHDETVDVDIHSVVVKKDCFFWKLNKIVFAISTRKTKTSEFITNKIY